MGVSLFLCGSVFLMSMANQCDFFCSNFVVFRYMCTKRAQKCESAAKLAPLFLFTHRLVSFIQGRKRMFVVTQANSFHKAVADLVL